MLNMSHENVHSILLFNLVLFGIISSNSTAVPDPCPSYIKSSMAATMCTESSATEETDSGTIPNDSVVLRLNTQQEGCECYVEVQNHTKDSYKVHVRKYDGRNTSPPIVNDCGLAIDIDYRDPPDNDGKDVDKSPIECTNKTRGFPVTIVKDGRLKFRSRIVNGNFTRGYCMQISREHNKEGAAELKIRCINPRTITKTTSQLTETTSANMQLTADGVDTVPTKKNATGNDGLSDTENVNNMTVQDPCPPFVNKKTIADMCTDSSGEEETDTGNLKVDSVALRVVNQQSNCHCYVSAQNHTKSDYKLLMRKYSGDQLSVPTERNCGLAIDINYTQLQDNNDGPNSKEPIECKVGTEERYITLEKGGKLELSSRLINGSFTRGYCVQICRSHGSDGQAHISISCKNPRKSSTTRIEIDNTTPTTVTDHLSDKTSTHLSQKTDLMSEQTMQVFENNFTTDTIEQTSTQQTSENRTNADGNFMNTNGYQNDLLIICGGIFGTTILTSIVIVIVCNRKRKSSHVRKHSSPLKPNINTDVEDGLKDNVLYVSADEDVKFSGDDGLKDNVLYVSADECVKFSGDDGLKDIVLYVSAGETVKVSEDDGLKDNVLYVSADECVKFSGDDGLKDNVLYVSADEEIKISEGDSLKNSENVKFAGDVGSKDNALYVSEDKDCAGDTGRKHNMAS